MTLRIPADVYEGMVDHCRRGMPNEACGFLGGTDGVVEKLYPLPNAAASPVFYTPAAREMIAAYDDMDARGIELVGIFHSHVATRPYPSPTDVTQARVDVVYVIVSLAVEPPETRGYRIVKEDYRVDDGEIREVELLVG